MMNSNNRFPRKIVYVSHCLLNCNAKFPGSADEGGVYSDLILPLLNAGIGIEQMPCLEMMGWGGVDRKKVIYDLDPTIRNQDWVIEYPGLCVREAVKLVDCIEDYIRSGIEVIGIIYVSDSPTCGLCNTQTFPEVHYQLINMHIPVNRLFDFEYKSKYVWPLLKAEGEGKFGYSLYLEISKRSLPVKFIPFRPVNPRGKELARIFSEIALDNVPT
jgi:predicted secreted protein